MNTDKPTVDAELELLQRLSCPRLAASWISRRLVVRFIIERKVGGTAFTMAARSGEFQGYNGGKLAWLG